MDELMDQPKIEQTVYDIPYLTIVHIESFCENSVVCKNILLHS
jgi:hypothetical protein